MRAGYRIEKLVYESEPGIVIPALLFLPEKGAARKPAMIYVHGRGQIGRRGGRRRDRAVRQSRLRRAGDRCQGFWRNPFQGR